jgi:hypothetical protein
MGGIASADEQIGIWQAAGVSVLKRCSRGVGTV